MTRYVGTDQPWFMVPCISCGVQTMVHARDVDFRDVRCYECELKGRR